VVNPSFHLYQLQKIDLRVDTLSKRLMEIDKIRKDNSARRLLEHNLNEKNELFLTIKNEYAGIEDKIQSKKLKIEQSESSLYSGSIKNPKELQDLQTEISSLKQSILALEDVQLNKLIDLENAENDKNSSEIEIKQLDIKLAQDFSTLFAEESSDKSELEKLNHERKMILDQINPNFVSLYQELRISKKGIAISMIEDCCCSVCGSSLTPAEYQNAKSPQQMSTCPSCGRILYAG